TGMTGMLETIFIDHTFGSEKGAIKGQFVPAALTYSLIEGLQCQSMIQGTGLAMLELKQQIRAPVRVGDTIHGEIEIVSVRPTSNGKRGIVVSRIDVKNQRDEVVMSYEATRMLAGRDADDRTYPVPPPKGPSKGEGGRRRRPGPGIVGGNRRGIGHARVKGPHRPDYGGGQGHRRRHRAC